MNPPPGGKIDLLPDEARENYARYIRLGEENALMELIGAIFAFHEVEGFSEAFAAKGEQLVIMKDLEVDSLTLTEVVFFAEDLLDIKISNEEIQQIRTLADLKHFIIARRRGSANA